MERKTKHRILGILVVAAFGIIMLPFFEGGSNPMTEATVVKAPPFPDSSATAQGALNPPITLANSSQSAYNQQPDDTISANSPTAVAVQPVTPPSVPSAPQEHNANTTKEAESTAATDKKIIQADNKEVSQKNLDDEKKQADTEVIKEVAVKNDAEPETAADEEDETTPPKSTKFADKRSATKVDKVEVANKPIKPVATKVAEPIKHHAAKKLEVAKPFVPQIKPFFPEGKSVAIVDTAIDANGLAKLKNAAWVIQIGSFKNKTNALRLVNQLRAHGYRAFIQQVSDDGTRVFVGPEPKQNAARALAMQLESNMHIRGIVISYKPLAL